MQLSAAERMREEARQKSDKISQTWEGRTQLVKEMMAAASAANDEKTARLRALRLEKERQETQAGAKKAAEAAPRPRKSVRRINCE
jgi:hypothetical protein